MSFLVSVPALSGFSIPPEAMPLHRGLRRTGPFPSAWPGIERLEMEMATGRFKAYSVGEILIGEPGVGAGAPTSGWMIQSLRDWSNGVAADKRLRQVGDRQNISRGASGTAFGVRENWGRCSGGSAPGRSPPAIFRKRLRRSLKLAQVGNAFGVQPTCRRLWVIRSLRELGAKFVGSSPCAGTRERR
jgi:hypothetical protein